jgi:hypothetical protein
MPFQCQKQLISQKVSLSFSRYLIKLSGAGAGAVIQICGSAAPELKEIFSAPQHCTVPQVPLHRTPKITNHLRRHKTVAIKVFLNF